MPVFLLSEEVAFPDPRLASDEGILAVGGDLSVARILLAYRLGIFPWFNPEDPILWWCPDPRCVMFPSDLRVAKSMRSYFNQQKFSVTFDRNFPEVIHNCREIRRKGQGGGTWISDDIEASYTELHHMGYAHSVEVWEDGNLVGGLYGLAIGKCYFGESMFAHVSNASKFGFISLVWELEKRGFQLIDCQQQTRHLESLGAVLLPRARFLNILRDNNHLPDDYGSWRDWI